MEQRTILDTTRWWALALLCAAQFVVILDTSIIGVALPAIQTQLDFTPGGLSWIFNAYVVAFGGLLLLGGKLGDIFGARRIFMIGFAILSTASLVAGLAPSQGVLLTGRALQGIGAALIAPAALTLLMRIFGANPAELGRAFGFWGAAAAAGGTAGVFLGGVITEYLSWPWTFLINVPLGLAVLAASPGLLRYAPPTRGRVDWLGALTVTASLVTAVYAIVTTKADAWGSWQPIALLAIAIALLGVFLLIQKAKREPLLPLRIFASPNLAVGNLLMALLGAAWIPLWFYLNLYLQQALHFASGLTLLPMTVTIMIVMVGFSGRLIGALGIKANLVLGMLAMAGALFLFARVPTEGSFLSDVLPASLLAALGMALAYIPATMSGMAGARPEDTELASGLINTTYQIGSAIGLAVMVALAAGAGNSGAQSDLISGFHIAFTGAAILALTGAALALLLIRSKAFPPPVKA
ncbi:MAG: MFS transporter [Devosia sp.]